MTQHPMLTNPTPDSGKTGTIFSNHILQPLKDGTARLVIEWRPKPGPPCRPVAVCYSIDGDGNPVIRGGSLLGFDRVNPCALFLLVRPGDLLSVGEKPIGGSSAVWAHYKVRDKFRLEKTTIAGRGLTNAEIRSLAGSSPPLEQPPGRDGSMRKFLAYPAHPAWLVSILARQKSKWRKFRISKYYHLVPSEVTVEEIPHVIKMAPGAALRFFFPSLTEGAVRRCIGRDLETAIIHAFQFMTPVQVLRACREYPLLLLKKQGRRLPEDVLLKCVRSEPFDAFLIRNRFPARVHAKILAATCILPFELFHSGDVSGLPAEIETSFRQFPVEWLETHHDDFHELFQTLERSGKMKADTVLLEFLMDLLPPQHLPGLMKFIGDRI